MRGLIFVFLAVFALHGAKIDYKEYGATVERTEPNSSTVFSYSKVLKGVRNSVVNISTQKSVKVSQMPFSPFLNDPFFRQFFEGHRFNAPQERVERSLGSGVIISSDGYIVTNNHVVESASKVVVTISNGTTEYEAKIIGTDPKSDLAVIKIDAKNLNAVTFFDSDQVEVGDVVFAIGNPFGVGETITSGIVSATNRTAVGIVEYEDFIQTDAAINPGNSGGALINSTGALIGINSAILTRSGASHGVGFSIPSNMVKQITQDLIEKGKVTRAWLGVGINDLDENSEEFYGRKDGALVMSVEPNSPAAKAGIKRGDLIVKIDNKAIKDSTVLRNTVGSYAPNTKVKIELIRDKKSIFVHATLTALEATKEASATHNYDYKGAVVGELTEEIRKQLRVPKDQKGVVVKEVKEGSAAAKVGLSVGDIVVQVENSDIDNLTSFKNATRSDDKKRLFVLRRGAVLLAVL